MIRKLKGVVALMIISACALSMTACLGDDDDVQEKNNYTKEEAAQIIQKMSGDYLGNMYMEYLVSGINPELKGDSVLNVGIHLEKTDSVVHVTFPVKLLANAISGDEKLKAAVAAAEEQTLDIKLVLVKTDNTQYYGFYPIPQNNFKFNVQFDDETHEVAVTFVSSLYHNYKTFYAEGWFSKETNEIMFYLLPSQVTLDKTTTMYLTTAPMLYVGKKR